MSQFDTVYIDILEEQEQTKVDENTSPRDAIDEAVREAMVAADKAGEKISVEKLKKAVEVILKHKAEQQQKEAGMVQSWFDNKDKDDE